MMERNREIDRLRAFAVLMTMFAHFGYVTLGGSDFFANIHKYIGLANGVILFFVISGYVITKTLVQSLDGAGSPRRVLMAFWVKRSSRILPMALLWIAIPLMICAWFNSRGLSGTMAGNFPGAVAASAFYFNIYVFIFPSQTSIFGHYWSLALEEQFYLLFPFLLIVLGKRWRLLGLVVAWVALSILTATVGFVFGDPMLWGALIYVAAQRQLALPPRVPRLVGVGVSVLAGITLMAFQYLTNALPQHNFGITALSAISSLLLWLAAQNQGYIPSMGQRVDEAIDWVGTRSFGLYLIHLPGYMVAGELAWRLKAFDTILGRGAIATILIVIVTEACYRFVELPIRNWGRRMAGKRITPGSEPAITAPLRP